MRGLKYSIILLLAAVLGGCQNDGHIGWIFGVWRVAEYTADGVVQTDPLIATTTLAFQNNVVEAVALTDPHQSAIERYGTWSHEGDTFTLDFTHSDDATAPGTGRYEAPEWLGFTSSEIMKMNIERKGDREFTLTWTSPTGVHNKYILKKTW